MHILVIEDNAPTRELLRGSLERAGHVVSFAGRMSVAVRTLEREPFDVLIVDIGLPDGSGLDLCRGIRAQGVTTPILFLTARGEVGDRVAGLDAGGDDYLRKPFALAELHARIRTLARRKGLAPPSLVELGAIRIDFTARRLTKDGNDIPLTAREWEVLEVLAARQGHVVSRDDLLEIAWHDTSRAASESLSVILSRLRRKLGRGGDVTWIRTVRGLGYLLERS